ncbi:MAG: hypothetical protein HOM14_04825 [Gammaproteobacteria bacterium]|nr:hypothetical protein [Gammaproteobacteria bacterium]MBT3722684.1 hypothetical protein [Gammaproteobacteria bacterium]MBT4075940.1 hypothetical protein [Gammaproteobacteria bacterium]MBT4193887.1 hypothetical protein [Gammaproteobacteria bacterium]MBT4451521.1 hypothetical protein [Gammaproteobacteria bacterium]
MNKRDLESLGTLDGFPVKGAAVLGYFVEKGDVSGAFYVALVEQSGAKQYRLRWSDNSTEIFKDIQGKNSRYQYFYLLGYISKGHYSQYYNDKFLRFEEIPPIYGEPCARTVAAHRKQAREISKIKKEFEAQRSKIPDEITDGQSIMFVYARCLDDPVLVKGMYSKVYDGFVYANCDEDLEWTCDEDKYLYIQPQFLLSVGSEPNRS